MVDTPHVDGILSVDLAVPDLKVAARFYEGVWGLSPDVFHGNRAQFRAAGVDHYAVSLTQEQAPSLKSIRFSAPSASALRGLHSHAAALGVPDLTDVLEQSTGTGLEFSLRTPDGQKIVVSIVDGQQQISQADVDSRPVKLSHVVLNSTDVEGMTSFFTDVLGFRLSDTTIAMNFIRCSRDHHSLALAKGNGPSVNHIAFDMTDIDSLMYGTGRLNENGFPVRWGIGRHGPGNNVFCYFIDPHGFALEYTTGMQQIDEQSHIPGDADFWTNFPRRPCRWNVAGKPPEDMVKAFSGVLRSLPPIAH